MQDSGYPCSHAAVDLDLVLTSLRSGRNIGVASSAGRRATSHRLASLALVTVCVSSGCGGGGSSSTSAQPGARSTAPSATQSATAPGVAPSRRLLGTYTTTITGKEHFHFQGASQLTPGSPSTGKWELTLSPASATVTHLPDRFQATDQVVYEDGHRIMFAASTGCDFNLSPETTGLYVYRWVAGQLSLREIRDSCLDRAGLLTGELWHKQ